MNQINYQKELEKIMAKHEKNGEVPSLLLHSCCAPCSSYVLEYLSQFFKITVFYYNPNIYPADEYYKRVKEQQRFISQLPAVHPIEFIEGDFESSRYYEAVKGMEKEPEGGARCEQCFRLRLSVTAELAASMKMDYFTTTLTISPLKNARLLNKLGEEYGRENKVNWLPGDFKKRNGYKRSIELSAEYQLYRQNYCGCVFSQRENIQKANKL